MQPPQEKKPLTHVAFVACGVQPVDSKWLMQALTHSVSGKPPKENIVTTTSRILGEFILDVHVAQTRYCGTLILYYSDEPFDDLQAMLERRVDELDDQGEPLQRQYSWPQRRED